jgi:hypothetical protein
MSFLFFIEPDCSLPCLEESLTGRHPELDKSTLSFRPYLFVTHYNITLITDFLSS